VCTCACVCMCGVCVCMSICVLAFMCAKPKVLKIESLYSTEFNTLDAFFQVILWKKITMHSLSHFSLIFAFVLLLPVLCQSCVPPGSCSLSHSSLSLTHVQALTLAISLSLFRALTHIQHAHTHTHTNITSQ